MWILNYSFKLRLANGASRRLVVEIKMNFGYVPGPDLDKLVRDVEIS
jgi:hypothetical protein